MVMTAGEFEFDTIFFATQLDFVTVSYIIWIVFVILMPVLLTNLLVRGWGCGYRHHLQLGVCQVLFEYLKDNFQKCIINLSLRVHIYSMTGWFGC